MAASGAEGDGPSKPLVGSSMRKERREGLWPWRRPPDSLLQRRDGFAGLADVSISEDIPVEGEITVPVGSRSPDEDYSTLDEPVKDTIMRDLKAVGKKFVHVMYPKKSSTLLRDCTYHDLLQSFEGSRNNYESR
ncbi:hypothetical protein JD844_004459 [Phrynosoma platyrhinos]|uniref:Uncharacterized protein n=1 Tax=Phrynosoma platyrhinos TaxID=52577 RepID=A0ABQ7TPB8_PHRPL|nr:hypothetical protein JD844_004459 [Phrynosoma platyrhinos]